jgi:hypothetical protein
MKILLIGLALMVMVGNAAAQCCGDCAGDGSVTIDDLITAVNHALNGCAQDTPTGTPPTPTRTPTTHTPADRCPSTFNTQGNNLCLFSGTFNVAAAPR